MPNPPTREVREFPGRAIWKFRKKKNDVQIWDGNVGVKGSDSPAADAFGRLRVSEPETIFDSKQIFDNLPLFWDDQEVSGSGTSSTYSKPNARSRLAVSAATAGKRVRQTFMRFNYQPGKSQLTFLTGILGLGESGITSEIGIIDDDNGLAFSSIDGVVNVTRRTSVTGSAVDTNVAQSAWSLDKMDGTGESEITIDFDKTLIFVIDFEWLGVGRVRMGVVIAGIIYYVHEFLNSNVLTEVYMSTPNIPLRYSIENDGTGGAANTDQICSSVMSEGGLQKLGKLFEEDTGAIGGLSSGTTYAILGIRLKSANVAASILLQSLSMIASTNDQLHWEILWNPTVAGTFTYSDVANYSVQAATGANTNTITGGTHFQGGYLTTTSPPSSSLENAIRLGSAIDGTVDELVLAVTPITNNISIRASLVGRELS